MKQFILRLLLIVSLIILVSASAVWAAALDQPIVVTDPADCRYRPNDCRCRPSCQLDNFTMGGTQLRIFAVSKCQTI